MKTIPLNHGTPIFSVLRDEFTDADEEADVLGIMKREPWSLEEAKKRVMTKLNKNVPRVQRDPKSGKFSKGN